MAKFNSAISFTGKLGQIVGMKGMDGETYARMRTKPSNPKTTAQVDQRVKMALAGMLSKITPSSLLVGLDTSKRKRRTKYTSIIARAAQVTSTDKGVMAKLPPKELLFSDGVTLDMPKLKATYDGKKLTVSLEDGESFTEDVAAALIIGVFADLDNGEYISVNGAILSDDDTSVQIAGWGGAVNVYAVPLGRAEGASYVSYKRVIDRIVETPYDYAALATIDNGQTLRYGRSKFEFTSQRA